MLKHGAVSGKVLEISDLQHLDAVVEKAGSSLLVVFFYTRSCGVCKELMKDFKQLCEEVRLQACRQPCDTSCMSHCAAQGLCGYVAVTSQALAVQEHGPDQCACLTMV